MEDLFIGVQDSETTAVGLRLMNAADAEALTRHVEAMKAEVRELEALIARGVPPPSEQRPFLYCLNLVFNKLDSSVSRGAIVKSMAICTPHHFIDVFKPIIMLTLDRYYKKQSIDVLSDLYFALNAVDFGAVPKISDPQRIILRHSSEAKKKLFDLPILLPPESQDAKPPKLNLRIPLTTYSDEVGDVSFPPIFFPLPETIHVRKQTKKQTKTVQGPLVAPEVRQADHDHLQCDPDREARLVPRVQLRRRRGLQLRPRERLYALPASERVHPCDVPLHEPVLPRLPERQGIENSPPRTLSTFSLNLALNKRGSSPVSRIRCSKKNPSGGMSCATSRRGRSS